MMNLTQFTGAFGKGIKGNSPIILSVAAGVGVITTAYLTGIASYQAAKVIKAKEDVDGTPTDRKQRLIERTKLVWKLYIPAGISATTTIGCIAGANRISNRKTLAATSALAFTERAYSEYRDKIIEEYGARKDQAIRDKVISDQVKESAPSQEVLVTGPGDILCCELFTMRYFKCDMEKLRRSVNNINAKMMTHDYQTLNDFYYMVGLPYTSESGRIGWESSKLMDLSFSTTLTEDGRPCITFEYNYTKLF
jgi:Family of unknown function (DUF6353)